MNKRVAKEWVKALRSGHYKQCTQVLSSGEGTFCVLGLLCELYRARQENAIWVGTTWQQYAGAARERAQECRAFVVSGDPRLNDDKHMPPLSVWDWAGLEADDVHSLSAANDRGDTFEELAYVIDDLAQNRRAYAPA